MCLHYLILQQKDAILFLLSANHSFIVELKLQLDIMSAQHLLLYYSVNKKNQADLRFKTSKCN
jgi:hypothetical protein